MRRGFRPPRDAKEAMETMRKLPAYGRLIWALARDPRVPVRQKLLLGGIAAYLAMPIDIIPDFIPVIGQLDDLGVLVFGLDFFIRNAPKDVVEEHMARIARNDDELKHDLERAQGLLTDRASELRATLDRILSRDREGEDR
ncbi:MAG TPA: YkvA family protein [Candidatus Limnocylindria bacterium]|nr:YkvA family protein [Candidatus Limnocylindria bacterium]